MAGSDIFFLVSAVLGGLALFIFGMNVMTDGLRHAAGSGLRTILARTGRSKLAGLCLGTVLGILVHSSATTVMLVGFVNAGLMTLAQTVPPMLGSNIGTTLSMQFVSFKLGAYCYVAIVVGFVFSLAGPSARSKEIGRAILGFGLLFLGMNTMSDAIKPHRAALAPFLATIDGTTWPGMVRGVALSLGLTAVWQSSGATIAICFALSTAGAFTRLEQVYPIILGAHIGTCATALLGSIGANIEARRSACAHLIYNIFSVALAMAAMPVFTRIAELSSGDLVRQIANVNTVVKLASMAVVLPFSGAFAKLVTAVIRSSKPPPEPSHLDPELLRTPETAIVAAISELRRVAKLCVQSLRLAGELLVQKFDRKTVQALKLNETVIDEIKLAMRDFLNRLTVRYLSRRQAILVEYVNRCMADIERIGDHVDEIGEISLQRRRDPHALMDRESMEQLMELYGSATVVVSRVVESFDVDERNFREAAKRILDLAWEFDRKALETKELYGAKMGAKALTPVAGMYYMEYISALERVVKHASTIAVAVRHPDFWIKDRKLAQEAKDMPPFAQPEMVEAHEFLARLGNLEEGVFTSGSDGKEDASTGSGADTL